MRSQEGRNVQVIYHLLPRGTDGQQLKHLPPHHPQFGPPIPTQEADRLSKSFSQPPRSLRLNGIRDIPEEYQDFESGVCRTEILEFVWSRIGGSDESLGDYPLANRKTGSEGLVCDVRYRGWGIVDADPRGEPAEGLESPNSFVSNRFLRNGISGKPTLRTGRVIRRPCSLA